MISKKQVRQSLVLGSTAIVGISLACGCSRSSSSVASSSPTESTLPNETLTFNGALVVKGNWDRTTEGGSCWIYDLDKALENLGRDDFEAEQGSLNQTIQSELKVVIKNSSEETIALGNLGKARAVVSKENPRYHWCAFPISVPDLKPSNFYKVAIGSIEQDFTKTDIVNGKNNIYIEEETLKNNL